MPSASSLPGPVLGPRDVAVNKMVKIAFPQSVYISVNLTLNRTPLLHMSACFVPKNSTGRLYCFC